MRGFFLPAIEKSKFQIGTILNTNYMALFGTSNR
jgi:hypothetical protein